MNEQWLERIKWNADGLIPVIAQDAHSGKVLMLAWMNRESLQQTVVKGEAIYWSRSRSRLWRKGETSGNVQVVKCIRLDCDNDALLIAVEPKGGLACHTGRYSCFFQQLQEGEWVIAEPVLKDPQQLYGP